MCCKGRSEQAATVDRAHPGSSLREYGAIYTLRFLAGDIPRICRIICIRIFRIHFTTTIYIFSVEISVKK